jgi:HAD superfamily 5'-nucleotidase-like hydrolase
MNDDSTRSDDLLERIDPARLEALSKTPNGRLAQHAIMDGRPPMQRRVFVNRTLRMSTIRVIGFDLDWTLADYNRGPMDWLAFELTRDRLISEFGYPKAIESCEYREDFVRRGLIIDRKHGAVLKMNRHRYVGRAYEGRSRLSDHLRRKRYRTDPLDPSSDRFYHVDTLFELPEVGLFSEVVELHRHDPEAVPVESFEQLFLDVRRAIDSVHADGSYKRQILANLPRYLPRGTDTALAIRRLALGGRKMMLITNSEWYYTEALCSHLFDGCLPGLDSWRDLFDLVIVSSKKPKFFRERLPFHPIDPDTGEEGEPVDKPSWGGIYRGGCREGLMELVGKPGDKVLYIGDHIYGDIVATKLGSTWRTALIVRELEDEILQSRDMGHPMRRLLSIKHELADLGERMDDVRDVLNLYATLAKDGNEIPREEIETLKELVRGMREEHTALRHRARALQERVSKGFNSFWGSLFKQGGSKSLFAKQVTDFACLYSSRVSNFAFYGSDHFHRVLEDPMAHDRPLA